ncbi:MAG: hypothetical protein RL497_2646 [Pseudomonadota bacterium]|jgi:hypothetical protein
MISFGICGIVCLPFLWALERHSNNYSHIADGIKYKHLKSFYFKFFLPQPAA